MSISIDLDFTDVTAATGSSLGVLTPGLHKATIEEFTHYTDSGSVLYAYMNTGGIRHRERFNLSNVKALPFVKAFLLSAGVPEKKLAGSAQVPFEKLVGNTVYLNYTPPQIDQNGNAVKGTYAKYNFFDKKRFEKLSAASAPAKQAEEATTDSGGDFDFLLNE